MFVNTKLLGIKIPFHGNFEQVNLRFYVKRNDGKKWKRGVVFIKEIAPKPAIKFVANTVYKENYETLPMRHQWTEKDNKITMEYNWKKNAHWNTIKVRANAQAEEILPGSEAEFITEHYWGYARKDHEHSIEYEVTHPRWQKYTVIDHQTDIDFGALYGRDFDFLNGTAPHSVMLSEGSEITVENKTKYGA